LIGWVSLKTTDTLLTWDLAKEKPARRQAGRGEKRKVSKRLFVGDVGGGDLQGGLSPVGLDDEGVSLRLQHRGEGVLVSLAVVLDHDANLGALRIEVAGDDAKDLAAGSLSLVAAGTATSQSN
jgi:hypothetical protein